MKNRLRLRVAFDFCMQEKIKFRVSIAEIIIFLCLSMQITYMIASSYSYKERILQGIKVSPEQVGCCFFDTEESSEEIVQKIRDIPGIQHYGTIQTGMRNTCESLSFLRETQKQSSLYQDVDVTLSGVGIETVCMSTDLFEVMNIKLTAGGLPDEFISQEQDIVLYLDEIYQKVVQIGDTFCEYNKNGELRYRFIVGGFFDEDSALIDRFQSLATDGFNITGSISLEYGIIEVSDFFTFDSGFFTFDQSTDYDQVSRAMQEIAAESDGSVDLYQLSSIIRYVEQNADKNTLYLKETAVFLIIILILSVSAGQISGILTRTRDYGIWLASGACKKDLTAFILFQNVIRTGIAAVISAALMFGVFRMFYSLGETASKHLVNLIYLKYALPMELFLAVLTVFLSSLLPAGLLRKASSVNLIKGKVSG